MQQPNTFLKGYALNNLAVASWWHKHPNFRPESDDEEDKEQEVSEQLVQIDDVKHKVTLDE